MLTSLMQKSEDNSRTGFELAKQQLKSHIAHQKVEQFLAGQNISYDTNGPIADMTQGEPLVAYESNNSMSPHDQDPREAFASDAAHSCIDDTREDDDPDLETFPPSIIQPACVHEAKTKAIEDEELGALTSSVANTTSGFLSMGIQNESYVMPHTDSGPHEDDDDHHSDDVLIIQPEDHTATSKDDGMHAISISDTANLVADNDNTQTNSSDAMHLLTTTKPAKENLISAPKHPLHMYINDILTDSISLPAYHLLKLSCHNWAYSFTIVLC